MVNMKGVAFLRVAVALLCGAGGLMAQVSAPRTTSSVRSLVSRYLTAIQHRNYETIAELDDGMRLGEASIFLENPQSLWPKVIAEHRERKVRELKGEVQPTRVGIEVDLKYLRDEVGGLMSFVPAQCKWAISEIRADRDLWGHPFSRIFVTITYAARESSPKNAEGQPLQRAILEFTVMFRNHVMAGDVSWSSLPPESLKPGTETERRSPLTQPAPDERSRAPEAGAAKSETYRVSSVVSRPKLVSKAEPEYSPEARKAKFQGTVFLSAMIGVDGIPRDIKAISPLGLGLDERAIECVSKWRYEPGLRDGKPVLSAVTVEVNFRLL